MSPLDNLDMNTLTKEQKLLILAKSIGYKKMPPSIDQFIEDDYYLGKVFGKGKLYPIWKEELKEIFPTPIHTEFNILVFDGAIGLGKSTVAKIIALYNLCRLDHIPEYHAFFGIAKTKAIAISFVHLNKDKANQEFVSSINNEIIPQSPYFSNGLISKHPIMTITDGYVRKTSAAIGSDVLFYNFSELNFVNPLVAKLKLDHAFQRWKSRFLKVAPYFGNIILDSSANGDGSVTEEFVKNTPYKIKVIKKAIWEAKSHQNIYFKEKNPESGLTSFRVYSGDSLNLPKILKHDEVIDETMDPDRIVVVPNELYPDFKSNIVRSLADMAGVSTKTTGRLFPDPKPWIKALSIEAYNKEILTVDQLDLNDRLFPHIEHAMRMYVPKDKVVFIRFDLGLKHDLAGFAISFYDQHVNIDRSVSSNDRNSKIKLPSFRTPIHGGISRYSGQETSIRHIYQLILEIEKEWEIGMVSFDQYQSSQIMQDLRASGIPSQLISVDRNDLPYIYFKNLVLNELWTGCDLSRVKNEGANLQHIEGKVDHPQSGQDDGSISKDIMDAIVGSIYSIYNNLELATTVSSKYSFTLQNKVIQAKQQLLVNPVQNMLHEMYQ